MLYGLVCYIVTEITNHPDNPTTVVALENVILSCSSSATDGTYSWHRVNGSIPSGSTGQNTQMLTIRSATPPDNGMYYCVASNDGKSVESNRAAVTVNGEKDYELKLQ